MQKFGILLKDFSGGLNLKYDDDLMALSEARELKNCDPYSKGWIDRRRGCTIITTDGITDATSIDNLIRFYPNSTTKELICSVNNATNNKIYKIADSDGAETEIVGGTALTTATRIRFSIYKSNLFLSDGIAPIQYYDASGTTKADITGTPTPPIGKYLAIHKRRMYVAGNSTSPANLYYSGLGVYTTLPDCDFPAANVEPIGDETLPIMGIIPQQDHIVIFKENTFHKWIGTADYDFRVLDTNRPYGCIAPDSIAMCEGWVVFLSHDGIRAYDGGLHCVLLSDKITPIIDGSSAAYGMDEDYRDTVSGIYHDGLYRLLYRRSGVSYKDSEIIFNFRQWLEANGQKYSWYYNSGRNINCGCIYPGGTDQNEIILGDSNAGYIYKGESGYTDNIYGHASGQIIDMFWNSKKIDTFEGASPHEIKKFRKLKMNTYLQGGTFELYFDVDAQRTSSTTVSQTTSAYYWNQANWNVNYWTQSVLRSVNLGLDAALVGKGISIKVGEKTGTARARIHNIQITGHAKVYK